MFVVNESVTELDAFLRGYIYARKTLVDIEEQERDVLRNFSRWLKKKNQYTELSNLDVSWKSILIFYHVNEIAAFRKFFELWDEYIKEQA